jgi:FMN-dependent oxidoreductase (nitrilotriacetate monooxygenase family)
MSELHFNLPVMDVGYHESAWRVTRDEPAGVLALDHYERVARVAERGLLDSLFFADYPGLAEFRVTFMPQPHFDPIDLVSALAPVTDHIGLIATGSTTYSAPWDLARRFASLDFLSAGRAGWNIVTTATTAAAGNFGVIPHPDPAARYARATEYVDVVQRVWDGWEDDALVASREQGIWADRGKLHPPHFHGEHFDVEGILPFPRSPQGHPVLAQAGSSPAGVALAARYAEVVFTAQPTVDEAVAFRHTLREQASGRTMHVLPGVAFVLGSTEAEARERRVELERLASSEFRWRNLLHLSGLDPEGFEPDAPLPGSLLEKKAPTSTGERVFAIARAEALTLRQIAERFAVLPGQLEFTGTPEQLAALIEEWFRAGAAEGFTLLPTVLPRELETFVDHVIPLLQARGLFRTEYRGSTLRDHFGLARPANRNADVAHA